MGLEMRKLLLIIPRFFTYEVYIKKEFEKLGYQVDMIYENLGEFSIQAKLSIRVFPDKRNFYDKYYISFIKNKHYHTVLAIRASTLSETVIKLIKESSPEAKLYMYQWDSVKNNENAVCIAPYFDMVSTFDVEDANKYNWVYRPLFYITESKRTSADRNYKLAYICTLHSNRVNIYKKLKKIKTTNFLYLYSNRTHYYKEKYINRNSAYTEMEDAEVKFKSLTLEEANQILGKTDIVVDYTHPAQTGFTMRTCEAIGHRCKILTNNKRIEKADFYNPDNIYVYDEKHFDVPDKFLNGKYEEIPVDIYEKYKISTWIKDVINYDGC